MNVASTNTSSAPPLVFIYRGAELPTYAIHSLRFAARNFSGRTVLLTDSKHRIKPHRGLDVEPIGDWYKSGPFENFKDKTSMDTLFRGGFWLRATERFFVLRQYLDELGVEGCFHAELDVMVFDIEGVAEACNHHGSGIFAVMDGPSRALASLFYVNSVPNFDHFLDYAAENADCRNEMELLGSYLRAFPDKGHSFPTTPFRHGKHTATEISTVKQLSGVFDGSAIGQWLFGVDPQNISRPATNHFRNENVAFDIERLKFTLPLFGKALVARSPSGSTLIVRTLHVHSKIIGRLTVNPIMRFYLWVNNLPVAWPIAAKRGLVANLILNKALRGVAWRLLERTSRFSKRAVPGLLLGIAASSANPLSVRQRRLVLRLLPQADFQFTGHRDRSLSSRGKRQDSSPALNRDFNQAGKQSFVRRPGSQIGGSAHSSLSKTLIVLLEAEVGACLVDRFGVWALETQGLVNKGRFPLAVTAEKRDIDCLLVTSKWGETLDNSLCFSTGKQLVRPDWVREMFPEGQSDWFSWLESQPRVTWGTFIQAYGSWARTHHRKSIFLVAESSGPGQVGSESSMRL